MRNLRCIPIILMLMTAAYSQDNLMTLDECIQTALKNNTNILNARAMLQDYRLQKKVAMSDYLPTVGLSLDYYHQEIKMAKTQFQLQSPFFVNREYSAGLSVQQTLWDGGRTIANNKRAEADYKASKFAVDNTRQELIFLVEEAYLNLLKQKQLTRVYKETLNSSLEALHKSESMEAVGMAVRTDVLKAKVKVEDDRLMLIKAQNDFETAKANLNYLMGVDVNRPLEVSEIIALETMNVEYEEAVKIALSNHPQLKKAKYEKESAQHTIAMERSAILPQLTGSYRFGTESPNLWELKNPFNQEYNWSAVLSLSVNLFDGLASHANIQRAKIGKRSAEDNYEQIKRDVIMEVKKAYLGLEEAQKSIAAAAARVASAEEDLKFSTTRYELGTGTILEQIDAQVALTSARAQKIQAEYDYRFAQSRLKKAMGKLNY